MDRKEALQVLNLQESAGLEDIRKQYEKLFSEYQLQLTNAPTPQIKKLKQDRLKELDEAKNILIPDYAPGNGNYPSIRPILEETDNGLLLAPKEATSKRVDSPSDSNYAGAIWGVLIVLCMGLAALSIFFFLELKQARKDVVYKQRQLQELEPAKPFAKNGKFKVKNVSQDSIWVYNIQVWYLDASFKYQKYSFKVEKYVKPGGYFPDKVVEGTRTIWNGEVLIFALWLHYKDKEFIQTGIWQNEVGKNSLLEINMDHVYKKSGNK